jgi:two-component system, LytTR family, sensor kinase
MIRRLYEMALITSPIIAIYGVLPFFVFEIINIQEVVKLTIGLALNTFIAWAILIQLKSKFPSLSNIWLFLASYGINLLIRVILIMFLRSFDLAKPPIDDKYFIYPIATSFAVNIVIIVIINSIVNTYRYNDVQRELHEIKLQSSEAQKLSLINQMQPHFLFNALSNLKSLIKENPNTAEDYIIKLADFLRYSVESHQSEVISLEKELEFTRDYIDLQKVRFENAFTYNVDIHFTISGNENSLTVWNKKTMLKNNETTSTGLTNLNKRYELIHQKSIVVKDTDEDFTVTISLIPT